MESVRAAFIDPSLLLLLEPSRPLAGVLLVCFRMDDMGAKDPTYDEDAEIDLARLSVSDREAIMARVTPDDSVPPDAFALAQNEIRREMIDRGIQPKGFYNDDAARLQEEFNREHVAEKESRMQQKIQFAARNYMRETVHRRRMEREHELREEVQEIARNAPLEVWLGLAACNDTPMHATLRLSSVGTRALCKALVFNQSLQSLNLSRNNLDDMAGKCLALLLRRSSTLSRLDLESNCFGPAAARDLAEALAANDSLVYLNLESNPLTDDEKDFTGVVALGRMLASNKALRTLILWRTRLSTEGGKQLAIGMEKNETLLCLDMGNNRIATSDAHKIDARLAMNRKLFEQREQQKLALRAAQRGAADKERSRQEGAQKKAEYVGYAALTGTWLVLTRLVMRRKNGSKSGSWSASRSEPSRRWRGSAWSNWKKTGYGSSRLARP